MRIYFIDGPAAGRSHHDESAPRRVESYGGAYRRVRQFRSTTFYRQTA